MRSAPITLDSRCARISVVRPAISRSSACWITASFSASTEDSASSRIRIGASRSKRAGDRQPLALAARQPHAALADHGRVALRQRGDEFVRVGVARRGFELGLASRPACRGADSPRRCRGTDRCPAARRRSARAQRVGIERRRSCAADPHRARLRIEEPQQQPRDRRFADAARRRRCRSSRRRRP